MGKWSQYRLRGTVRTPLYTEVLLWDRQVEYDPDTGATLVAGGATANRVSRPIQLQSAQARITRVICPVQRIADGGGGSVSCFIWPTSATLPVLPPITASSPVLLSSISGIQLVEFVMVVPHVLPSGQAWYVGLICAGAGSTVAWQVSASAFSGGGSYTSASGASWADAPLGGNTLPYAAYGELV